VTNVTQHTPCKNEQNGTGKMCYALGMKKLSQFTLEANQRALRQALGQQRLEGQEVSPETKAELERVAKGEMTIEDVLRNARARHLKLDGR